MPKPRFLTQAILHGLLDPLHTGIGRDSVWRPLIDVVASPELACVRLELAGISMEDLEISISGNRLRVSGRRPMPVHVENRVGLGYRRAEIQYGTFERTVELPWLVDAAHINMRSTNGLWELELVPLRLTGAGAPSDEQEEA